MATVCRLFALSPAEYWDLPYEEEGALFAHLAAEQKAREKAATKRHH